MWSTGDTTCTETLAVLPSTRTDAVVLPLARPLSHPAALSDALVPSTMLQSAGRPVIRLPAASLATAVRSSESPLGTRAGLGEMSSEATGACTVTSAESTRFVTFCATTYVL